jgi:hypothetical protein
MNDNEPSVAWMDLMDTRVPLHQIPQKRFHPRFIADMALIRVILKAGPQGRTDEQLEAVIRRIIGWFRYLGRYDRKRSLRPQYAKDAEEMQALLDRWCRAMAAKNRGMWGPGFRRH